MTGHCPPDQLVTPQAVPQDSPRRPRGSKALILAFICAFILALALSLTITDITSTHEARVAGVARNMLQTGNYWVPYLNGVPRLEKAPLVYWIAAGSGALWGRLDEFSLRLPSLLTGLACVTVTILIGRTLLNGTVGLLAGLVQISTFAYWRDCHKTELDLYLTFFISLGILAFCRLYFARRRHIAWVLLFWVALGCAASVKNPLPVLPAFAVCGLGLLLCKRQALPDLRQPSPEMTPLRSSSRLWPWHVLGILLFVALASVWWVSMAHLFPRRGPGVWRAEVSAVLTAAHQARPMYHYLTRIFIWAFPWSVFVPAAFVVAFTRRGKADKGPMLFLFLWMTVILASYSLWPMSKKKIQYLHPMLPAFALLTAWIWTELYAALEEKRANFGQRLLVVSHAVLLSICGAVALGFALLDRQGRWIVALIGAALLLLGITGFRLRSARPRGLFWGTALASLAGMVVAFIWFLPDFSRQTSPRLFAQRISQHGGAPGRVVLLPEATSSVPRGYQKLQGIPPLGFYMGYNIIYKQTSTDFQEFLKAQPQALVVTWGKHIDTRKFSELGLQVLHEQSLSQPTVELTAARLPQAWQKPVEWLIEKLQRPTRKTLLLGRVDRNEQAP